MTTVPTSLLWKVAITVLAAAFFILLLTGLGGRPARGDYDK